MERGSFFLWLAQNLFVLLFFPSLWPIFSDKIFDISLPLKPQLPFPALLTSAAAMLAILFVNPLGDFPLNDDWQYAYPVKSWVEEGAMAFKGVFAPNILLQVVWGYLFCKLAGGFDFTWIRLSTLILAGTGVVVLYNIVKRYAPGGRNVAFFAAAALASNPLFFSLSFSFMTDVPFLALCLLGVYAFHRYMENGGTRWLFAAAGWAVGSYLIRQPGILLLPAFALSCLFFHRFTKKSLLVAAGLLALGGATYLGLEFWLKPALGIVGNFVPVGEKYSEALLRQPLVTGLEWVKKLLKTFIYLGFFGLPFLPFLWSKIKSQGLLPLRYGVFILLANALLFFFLVKIGKPFPFGGNVLYNFGLGPELLADVYTLGLPNTPRLPDWAMLAVQFVSQLSATLLVWMCVKAFPSLAVHRQKQVLFHLLLNVLYLPLMSITSFFDRYLLLPLASFFFVLALFLPAALLRSANFRYACLVLMALFSLMATKDYLAWNRAKHEAFNYLQAQGIGIREMDAGYEYNGFYNYHPKRDAVEGRSFWWVTSDDWLISFGPVPGYEQVQAFPYRRMLFFKKDEIRVLKRK